MPQPDKLTFRQRRFVDEYLACGIGTKAVIAAGYTGKYAHKVAFALTRQPKIKRAIQAAYTLQQQRLERQQDILLSEYVRLIEEAREAGDYKGSLKALNNLFDRLKLSERILAQPLLETLESNPDDLYEVLNQAIQLMAKAGRHTDLVKLLELRVRLQLGDKSINSETVIETVF